MSEDLEQNNPKSGELKTKQFDLLLNESGEFYYKSDKFEIKKAGREPWQYEILMDGKPLKYVLGVDISLSFGRNPIIALEIIDA